MIDIFTDVESIFIDKNIYLKCNDITKCNDEQDDLTKIRNGYKIKQIPFSFEEFIISIMKYDLLEELNLMTYYYDDTYFINHIFYVCDDDLIINVIEKWNIKIDKKIEIIKNIYVKDNLGKHKEKLLYEILNVMEKINNDEKQKIILDKLNEIEKTINKYKHNLYLYLLTTHIIFALSICYLYFHIKQ
jgi:hypothetical protein